MIYSVHIVNISADRPIVCMKTSDRFFLYISHTYRPMHCPFPATEPCKRRPSRRHWCHASLTNNFLTQNCKTQA